MFRDIPSLRPKQKKKTWLLVGLVFQVFKLYCIPYLYTLFLKEMSECFSKEIFKMRKAELQDFKNDHLQQNRKP